MGKNKIWMQKEDHSEIREHSSETSILVIAPGGEHNTVQNKHRKPRNRHGL